MISRNFRRVIVLGSVSSLAIASQATAGTATQPVVASYAASGIECRVTIRGNYTGTTADFTNNSTGQSVDQFQIVGQDSAGNDVTFNNTFNVPVGTTATNALHAVGFRTANTPRAQGVPSIVIFDRDRSSRVARLGSVQVDLAQMNAVGGVCASVAQQYGFVPAGGNQRPNADAGPDSSALVPNQPFVIDGSSSSDPDGDPLTYTWRQVSGSSIGISGQNTSTLTLTPPSRGLQDRTYTFELTVSDGNGGFDSDLVTVTLTRNVEPTPNAGPDQTVQGGATVQLDGSASSDPEGDPLTYTWQQLSGPPVTLTNPSSATPTFVAPAATSNQQSIRFGLKVNDGLRNSRLPEDTVTIFIAAAANGIPVANAGPDQTVARGDTVQLDGSGSTDPDNDPLTYSWTQTGGPAVTLNGSNSATPSFTAPNVDRRGATFTFELTTTDPNNGTSTDTVQIVISSNAPPTPNAGPDQTVQGGSTVTLDGSGSTDPEGDPITYSWGQSGGPAVTLNNANSANPTFVAPAATATTQTLRFTLVVDDGMPAAPNSVTSLDTVTITIPAAPANPSPVADAGTGGNVTSGSQVALDASGSSDPNGDPLTYSWTQVSGPAVQIASAGSQQANWTVPSRTGAQQTFVFEVTVSDGTSSSTDTVTYVLAANGGPVAQAGPDQTVAGGSAVTLDASGSSDPDGDSLTYNFVQTGGPGVTLTGASTATPGFTAPAATGTAQVLTFEVTVSDGVSTDTDTVAITVAANRAPIAVAGPDRTVDGGSTVTLDASGSSDPDGDRLTYSFTQTGGPGVTLSNANTAMPSFAAPLGIATTQVLTFEVTVSDGTLTTTDTIAITVSPNSAPSANAGADIGPVNEGQNVTLNGTASSDPDGDTLTYSWVQVSGPQATLSNTAAARPTFTAPNVSGTEDLVFELTVDDGQRQSTDQVRVTVRERASVTIIQRVIGDDTTVGFTTNVPGLATSVTTANGTGTVTASGVGAGNYSFAVDDIRARGYALTGIACSDTDSTINQSNRSIGIALSPGEALTCTVTLTDTRSAAQQAIGEFVGGRNALLLANQPGLQRRLDRVRGQQANAGTATIGQVHVPGSGKLPAQLSISPTSKSFSSSLGMARSALGDGNGGGKLDIWFEGTIADVTLGASKGNFLLGYAGLDYLVSDDVLIGALVQFDRFDHDGRTLGAGQGEGEGWMAGPYVTARVSPNFYLDARVALGSSDNSISPLGTFVDGFETDRLLASASAIGSVPFGEGFTFWPEVSVRYIREDIEGYVDALGVAIPDAEVDQGEIAFSPRVDYRSVSESGWAVAPYAQFEGVLTFGSQAFSLVDNGLRGRGSAGLEVTSPTGMRFGISGFYDGVGENRYEAAGATVSVSITF